MVLLEPDAGKELLFTLSEEGLRKETARTDAKVAVREPVVLKLDADLIGGDPVLLAEHQKLSGIYDHFFISFGCTFIPSQGEAITSAEVEVRLEPSSLGKAASIHSMRPDRVVNRTEITSSAKIDADFRLAKFGAGGEATFDKESLFLVAYPAGDHGFWEFSSTAHASIAGQYPLQMIVRAPAAVPPRGWVSVSLLLNRKRYFIMSDERREEAARIDFTCA